MTHKEWWQDLSLDRNTIYTWDIREFRVVSVGRPLRWTNDSIRATIVRKIVRYHGESVPTVDRQRCSFLDEMYWTILDWSILLKRESWSSVDYDNPSFSRDTVSKWKDCDWSLMRKRVELQPLVPTGFETTLRFVCSDSFLSLPDTFRFEVAFDVLYPLESTNADTFVNWFHFRCVVVPKGKIDVSGRNATNVEFHRRNFYFEPKRSSCCVSPPSNSTDFAKFHRLFQTADRVVVSLLFDVVLSEIGVRFDVIRIEIETVPNVLINFVPLLQLDVTERSIDVISGFFAVLFQRLVVTMNRIVVFLL